MIVAVFCVAAAMIAGGAWAVFTGWEFIIIERGWTQVLLGGMLITGGLLLGGIGVLATHVKRLAGKLEGLPRGGLSPITVSEAAPDKKRDERASQSPSPRTDAPIMPPAPRPVPRNEPVAEPVIKPALAPVAEPASEPTERPVGPAISAPAAIALGAAAGAGTAAIASALLSTGAPPRAEDAGPTRDVEAEAEDAEIPSRSSGARDEAAGTAANAAEIPAPDGEDADMLWGTESAEEQDLEEQDLEVEDLEVEALEAEAVKAEGLRGAEREEVRGVAREPVAEAEQDRAEQGRAEQDRAEPVIPPIEEPLAETREPEPEPEVEPEERYSAPAAVAEESAVAESAVAESAAAEPAVAESGAAEPFAEEEVREAEPRPAEFSDAETPAPTPPEQPLGTPPEEPVEQMERTLVGTYESGGNIYTMYSDGSIDAKTPTGDYHFASLEELKSFIAEGGEDPLA
jgi:hypothetical protein